MIRRRARDEKINQRSVGSGPTREPNRIFTKATSGTQIPFRVGRAIQTRPTLESPARERLKLEPPPPLGSDEQRVQFRRGPLLTTRLGQSYAPPGRVPAAPDAKQPNRPRAIELAYAVTLSRLGQPRAAAQSGNEQLRRPPPFVSIPTSSKSGRGAIKTDSLCIIIQ